MAMLLYKLVGLAQNWVILYPEDQKALIQSKVEMIRRGKSLLHPPTIQGGLLHPANCNTLKFASLEIELK
jgi:hypothetical protein